MDKLNTKLLEVLKLDIIIGLVIGACTQIIFGRHVISITFGISMAFINLAINATITHWLFKRNNSFAALIFMISYLLRILLTSLIGYGIFTYNINSALAFIFGYAFHFASLIIISISSPGSKERM